MKPGQLNVPEPVVVPVYWQFDMPWLVNVQVPARNGGSPGFADSLMGSYKSEDRPLKRLHAFTSVPGVVS